MYFLSPRLCPTPSVLWFISALQASQLKKPFWTSSRLLQKNLEMFTLPNMNHSLSANLTWLQVWSWYSSPIHCQRLGYIPEILWATGKLVYSSRKKNEKGMRARSHFAYIRVFKSHARERKRLLPVYIMHQRSQKIYSLDKNEGSNIFFRKPTDAGSVHAYYWLEGLFLSLF